MGTIVAGGSVRREAGRAGDGGTLGSGDGRETAGHAADLSGYRATRGSSSWPDGLFAEELILKGGFSSPAFC